MTGCGGIGCHLGSCSTAGSTQCLRRLGPPPQHVGTWETGQRLGVRREWEVVSNNTPDLLTEAVAASIQRWINMRHPGLGPAPLHAGAWILEYKGYDVYDKVGSNHAPGSWTCLVWRGQELSPSDSAPLLCHARAIGGSDRHLTRVTLGLPILRARSTKLPGLFWGLCA